MATPLGGALSDEISLSYNSFAGADIRAVIGPYTFAQLQAIQCSVTREKAPIYTLGMADARSYSRNKRGIGGTLIWINFDRHALLDLVERAGGKFLADKDEIRPEYQDTTVNGSAIFASDITRGNSIDVGATIDQLNLQTVAQVGDWKQTASPWYSDQVLPFDITLAAANEYGAMAASKIFGVEILNEGFGTSIDDAVSEMQATFVARTIEPMAVVASPYTGDGTLV